MLWSILNLQKEIFGLPLDKMKLAIKREHSIPIQFNGTVDEKNEFFKIINDSGLTIQTGGRIMNICDNTNKSKAMLKTLLALIVVICLL